MKARIAGVRPRLIPCLLLRGHAVFTTSRFSEPKYVGDLLNTVRIFNELEVDELMLLSIDPARGMHGPDLSLLRSVVDECFMPLCYGGGVNSLSQMDALYKMGIEKVSLNSALFQDPELLSRAADRFGRQAVMASIDAQCMPAVQRAAYEKRNATLPRWYARNAPAGTPEVPALAARYAELGAGELLLSSVDRDGTRTGYDTELLRQVCAQLDIPVIANCGADTMADVRAALAAGASATAASTTLVRQKALGSVLIHYPSPSERKEVFAASVEERS